MQIDEEKVREMVRLLGEVVSAPGGHGEKKRVLMEGLCKLISADAWLWTLSCRQEPSQPQVYVSFQYGGFSEQDFVKVVEASEHPEMIEIASKFFLELQKERTHLTRMRFQITDKDEFLRSGANEAWKAANVGPVILSLRPLDERSASTIALYRHYDREDFSPYDSRIAHIMLSEVPWLHEQGWPEDRGVNVPTLARRQRLALNLLLLGRSRKQIADEMRISLNTVQGYIKDVYRFFAVNSHAELMRRFLVGNGKDQK
jgi:DNA-binding CsgD family transcriptional regulator